MINDTVAVDCGALGFWSTSEAQARIKNLFLTHSHADHIATLPIFVENSYEGKPDCVTVWGNAAVLNCIREDIFNDRFWPDFLRLAPPGAPFLELAKLESEVPVVVDGIRVTPVLVNHTVRCFGMILQTRRSSVVIISDTAPTERIWEIASGLPNLKAVYLEAAFPNKMHELAVVSKHLTPTMFGAETKKLRQPTTFVALHLKARYREKIGAELMALGLSKLQLAIPNREYTW